MNIFREEFRRIFTKRSALLLFIFIIASNLSVNYFNEQRRFSNKDGYTIFSTVSYRNLKASLKDKQAESLLDYIDMQYANLKAYQELSTIGCITSENIDKAAIVKQYEAGELIVYTDNAFSELALFETVKNEMEDVYNYKQYLEDIQQSAHNMSMVSLFSDESSFYYRNIQKTAADYALLKGIEPKWDESAGVRMATEFPDILMVIGILYLCLTLITDEREMFPLFRTTRHGRAVLIRAKIRVCLLCVLILHTIMTATMYLFADWYYGLGELSRPIQSVFISAPRSMSVLNYLLLSYLVRLLVYAVFAVIFTLVCIRCRSIIVTYASIAGLLGIGAVLYYVIAPYSYLNYLKYINLYFLLKPSQLLVSYININAFGYPFNLMPVALIFCILAFAAGYVISVRSFSEQYISKNSIFDFKGFNIRLPQIKITRLFSVETWRLFIANSVLLLFIIFLLFQCWKSVSFKPYISLDEVAYRNILDEARLQKDPYNWIQAEYAQLTLNGASQTKIDAALRLQKQLQYLKDTEITNGRIGTLVYETGYNKLIDNPDNDILNALLLVVMLIICIPPVRESVLNKLYRTMPKGRRHLTGLKLLLIIITAAIIYLLTYMPYLRQILRAYGLPDADAPAFSLQVLKNVHSLSLGGYLITIFLSRFVLSLLIAMAIYIFSKRGITFAVVSSSVIFVLPLLLSVFSIHVVDDYPINILLKANPIHSISDFASIVLPILLFLCFLLWSGCIIYLSECKD